MIVRKATIYTLGEFSNRIGKALAIFFLAYLVSKEQYGIYTYLVAASAIVTALLDSGLNTLVILRASVQRFGRLFLLMAAAKFVVFAVVMCALLAVDFVRPLFGNLHMPVLAPFIALAATMDMQAFVGNSLRARLDYDGDASVKVIGSVGFLALLGALSLSGHKIDATAALWCQSAVLSIAVAFGIWRLSAARSHFVRLGPHAVRGLKALLLVSLPFAASSFCGSFFNTIDTLMLGMLSAFSANATFSLIHRVGLMSHVPIGVLVGFILPQLAAQFGKGASAPPARSFIDWIVAMCAIAGLGVSQLYVLGVDVMVIPTLGDAYLDAARVARILSLYVVPIYAYSIVSTVLLAKRFIVSPSILFAVATLLSAVLDYVVVRAAAPLMVAHVCAAMNWLLLGGFCLLYRKRLGAWPISAAAAVLVVAAGVAVLMLSVIELDAFGIAVRIIAFCAAMGLTVFVFFRGRHLLIRGTTHDGPAVLTEN